MSIQALGMEFGYEFAQKHGFKFQKPPRPEIPVSPANADQFTGASYICQAKFDGSAKIVHVKDAANWCVWTRHGEWRAFRSGSSYYVSGPQSAKMIQSMDDLAMFNGEFTVAGEWLDKAKPIVKDAKEFATGFVVWDVLEHPHIRKLTDGYQRRMAYLRDQVAEKQVPMIPATQFVTDALSIVLDYDCKDPKTSYHNMTTMGELYEGLVFRNPNAPVLDHRNLFKIRRAKAGIYQF